MLTGRVKWFNDEKGYGFIEGSGTTDVFVHYSVISTDGYKSLKEGDMVEFNAIETSKGLQAKFVKAVQEIK